MASIKKNKSGTAWQVRISYKDESGKFRVKNKSGFKTKREAQLYANEVENQSINGELSTKGNTLFPAYFEHWYNLYKEPAISRRTKLTYESSLHVFQEYFGSVTIGEMTRPLYQKFITEYGATHSKATMNKLNNHMRSCVKNAVYDDVIRKDFTDNVTISFNPEKTMKIDYLNVSEMTELANYLANNLNYHFTSRHMILTAIFTGMRLGEIQALTWNNINFNFKSITINKAWDETKREFKATKNDGSNRIIRINPELVSMFEQLKSDQQPESDSEQVFINQFFTVPTSDAVNKALRELLKKLDMAKQGFHFHSLRHTHVAYLLSNHVDLYLISKRLGHKDMTTTIRTYSYLIDEYKTAGDDEIETALSTIIDPACEISAERKMNAK